MAFFPLLTTFAYACSSLNLHNSLSFFHLKSLASTGSSICTNPSPSHPSNFSLNATPSKSPSPLILSKEAFLFTLCLHSSFVFFIALLIICSYFVLVYIMFIQLSIQKLKFYEPYAVHYCTSSIRHTWNAVAAQQTFVKWKHLENHTDISPYCPIFRKKQILLAISGQFWL